MLTAKIGVELQPCGPKHMNSYYNVSAGLTQGKGAVEVKQESLDLSTAVYRAREDRFRGGKEETNIKPLKTSCV